METEKDLKQAHSVCLWKLLSNHYWQQALWVGQTATVRPRDRWQTPSVGLLNVKELLQANEQKCDKCRKKYIEKELQHKSLENLTFSYTFFFCSLLCPNVWMKEYSWNNCKEATYRSITTKPLENYSNIKVSVFPATTRLRKL